jgi:hypothetical protein
MAHRVPLKGEDPMGGTTVNKEKIKKERKIFLL